MDYQVRPALVQDMETISALYAGARAFMARRGNPGQWGTNRPAPEQVEADIREENLYVIVENGKIHGVFALVAGNDPTYEKIWDGQWHSEEPYAAIHRVASDGSGGILHAAVMFAKEKYSHLRIDTHRDNLPMQRAIQREGFQYCGIILTDDGTPRLAYDRV